MGKLVATELRQIQKETFYRECFHKDENCSGRTIKAHSIQKNRILKKLSSNGLVLGFDYYSYMATGFNPFDPILKEIGVKKASTGLPEANKIVFERIFRSPKQVFYWKMRKLTLF